MAFRPSPPLVTPDHERVLQKAIASHQAGRVLEAEQGYRAILAIQPDHAHANHNLGVIAIQAGNIPVALQHFRVALEANAGQGQYWVSYLGALIDAGQSEAARQVLARGRQMGLGGEAVEALAARLHGTGPGGQSGPRGPGREEFDALVRLISNGQQAEAAAVARSMAERFPQHPLGWKALGSLLGQSGHCDEAMEPLRKAAELSPRDPEIPNNLGNVLKGLGRLDEAEASYREALRIHPDFAEAHYNLGDTLGNLGRYEEASGCYREALRIKPDYADAHNNLGNALIRLQRPEEAEACFRRALRACPHHVETLVNLGNVLRGLGKPAEAESHCRMALQIDHDHAMAHNNLGLALQDLGRPNEAEASFRHAIRLCGDLAEAHNNLGNALADMGRLGEAVACYQEALRNRPDFTAAHNNLGNALADLGRPEEAEISFRLGLKLEPAHALSLCNLGNALADMGRLDEAEAAYREALRIRPDYEMACSNLLFNLSYTDHPAAYGLDQARRFGCMASAKVAERYSSWAHTEEYDRLRVGLVSGDLYQHPVGYFLEGVLAELDANRIELFAYPTRLRRDALTERIRPYFSGWNPLVGHHDEAAAKMIHADGIHVLLDLSGHTAHNRLPVFAWRPAPVQASWLGYFATTGIAEMDYIIGDPLTLPETDEMHFTEKIWRLPETRFCFTPPRSNVPVVELPAVANGFVTFACFNKLVKMNDAVLALWARVLAAVPGSRLFLKALQLEHSAARQHVIGRFAHHGVGSERLLLEGFVPREEYLSAYQRADIALDPFPFTGGTTTAESLWMGVPVLTLAGDRLVSRQGMGLLANAGLADWIAADADDYVARAAAHASQLARLATLRRGLRQQVLSSPIFNAPRFARHLEDALFGMWEGRSTQTG